ncbi:hypothetical protein BGX38DRAFT_1150044 [Terfezia claveryi]|nr:hypothetical protein BGX38DRAFT_1150044 [Terfezia claveryi]
MDSVRLYLCRSLVLTLCRGSMYPFTHRRLVISTTYSNSMPLNCNRISDPRLDSGRTKCFNEPKHSDEKRRSLCLVYTE